MKTITELVQLIIEADKESEGELLLLNTTYHRMDWKDSPVGEENTEERMGLIKDYLIENDVDLDNTEEVFDLVFSHQYDETDGFKDVYVPFSAQKGDFATTEVAEFTFDDYKKAEEDLDECFETALDGERLDDIDSLIETPGTNFGYDTHEGAVIKTLRMKAEEFGQMFAVRIYPRRNCSGYVVNEGKDFEYDDYGDSPGPDEYVFFNQSLWKLEDFETYILSDMEQTIRISNKISEYDDDVVSPLYKKAIAQGIKEGDVIESVVDGKVESVKYTTDENQQPNHKNVTITDLANETTTLTTYDLQNEDKVLFEMTLTEDDIKDWLESV